MATERQDATTTISQSPMVRSTSSEADAVAAGVAGQGAAQVGQIAGNIQQISVGLMRDKALREAQEDAAQVVQRDENGNIKVPHSLEPKGLGGGLIYNEAYAKSAHETYRYAQLEEANRKAADIVARNPTDAAAAGTEMKAYVDGTLSAMSPELAANMRPHLEGVLAGAISSSNAGRQREAFVVQRELGQRSSAAYVLDVSKMMKQLDSGTLSPEVKAETEKKITDRWDMLEAQLKGAGHSPEMIEYVKQGNIAKVQAHVFGAKIEERAHAAFEKPAASAAIIKDIEAFARDPQRSAYSVEVQTILQQYKARGEALQATVAQADALVMRGQQDENAKAILAIKDLPFEQQDAARAAAMDRLLANSATMRPMQRLQLVTQLEGVKSYMHEGAAAAVTSASTLAQNGATPGIRMTGLTDLNNFANNPTFVAAARTDPRMAQLVNYAARTASGIETQASMLDLGTGMATLALGAPTETLMADARQLMRLNKSNDPAISMQIAKSVMAGQAAYATQRAGIESYASIHQSYNKAPFPLTEAQADVVRKQQPFETYNKSQMGPTAVPFDPTNASHAAQASAYIQRNMGVVPTEVKAALSSLDPKAANDKERQNAIGIADTTQNYYRKVLAGAGNATGELVRANMNATFGASTLQMIGQWKGNYASDQGGLPAKMNTPSASQRGDSAVGQDPAKIVSTITGMAHDASEDLFTRIKNGIFGSPVDANAPLYGPDKETRNALFAPLVSKLDGFDPDKLVVTPGFLKQATGHVQAYASKFPWEGENGFDVQKQGFYDFLRSDKNISVVRVDDPRTDKFHFEARYNDYETAFRNVHGEQDWTRSNIMNFHKPYFEQTNPVAWAGVNPESFTIASRTDSMGSPEYHGVAVTKDGSGLVDLGPVDPADPRLSVERQKVRIDIAKRYGEGVGRIIDFLGGGGLFRELVIGNKTDMVLKIGGGGVPSPAEASELMMTARNLPGVPKNVSQDSWDLFQKQETLNTVHRYGMVYQILFGNQAMGYLPFIGQRQPRQDGGDVGMIESAAQQEDVQHQEAARLAREEISYARDQDLVRRQTKAIIRDIKPPPQSKKP